MQEFDIVVLGSGPAGYVAALKGARLGKTVCLVEKKDIGGVCLNQGCIPTKAIIASVDALRTVKNAQRFGIEAGTGNFDFLKIIQRKAGVVKKLVSGVNFLLKQYKVEVVQGTGIIKEPGYVTIGDKELKAKSTIICTGSNPFLPFSIDHINTLDSEDTLNLQALPQSIAIIGGGVIGIELANIFCGLGTKVTIIEMLPKILPEVKDNDITMLVKKKLESQGVKIFEGTKVENISEGDNERICALSSGEKIGAEKVLVVCGRTPNTEQLQNIGLTFNRKSVSVDEHMRTNIPGIYAAGDVAGQPLLAHKASQEAVIAVENICGENKKMDYSAVPNCIFCSPEIACVGKFEAEVEGAKTGKYNFQGVGKALCSDDTEGFTKIVSDKDGIVKGMQVIGPHASDLIMLGVIAVQKQLKADELGELIYPHPTLSECLKEAFEDVSQKAVHKFYR
ncbi:MAG: dihydrolipoyl dehydrogenase [bacterium]|nr:dihydrolipoyl dehydrogenase [bacterium]